MKLRALVVEDCSAMRKLLMQALPLTGLAEFQFTEAEDGLEALSKCSPGKIDIIFVDWNMPKLSGVGFVRKLRASEKTSQIPIVMVTGNGTTGNVQEALDEAGADLYITKPYTVDELRKKLTRLIEEMAEKQSARSGTNRPGFLSRMIGGAS
jgi:two-component system chemotaxis response regulator CheY